MNNKKQLITMLRDELNRWETLIGGLNEAQITAPLLPSGMSLKDIIAHLWVWQQVSVARLEAALYYHEPRYPVWAGDDPDAEDVKDQNNARNYEANRDKPWSRVYADWKTQFLHFIKLAEAFPEKDLQAAGKYAWLGDYPLAAVLDGSYGHHQEHFEPLPGLLRERENENQNRDTPGYSG